MGIFAWLAELLDGHWHGCWRCRGFGGEEVGNGLAGHSGEVGAFKDDDATVGLGVLRLRLETEVGGKNVQECTLGTPHWLESKALGGWGFGEYAEFGFNGGGELFVFHVKVDRLIRIRRGHFTFGVEFEGQSHAAAATRIGALEFLLVAGGVHLGSAALDLRLEAATGTCELNLCWAGFVLGALERSVAGVQARMCASGFRLSTLLFAWLVALSTLVTDSVANVGTARKFLPAFSPTGNDIPPTGNRFDEFLSA